MKIQVQLSKNGMPVVTENEFALCSAYDPEQESKSWVQRAELKGAQNVVILGMGAGHHVKELIKHAPHIHITVVDIRPELFEIFEEHYSEIAEKVQLFNLKEGVQLDDRIFNFIDDHQPTVLCFKPAWKNHEKFFSDLFASFTFRNLEMIERSLKSEIANGTFDTSKLQSEKNLLHLKNLHESLKDFSDETALKISVLRELWI